MYLFGTLLIIRLACLVASIDDSDEAKNEIIKEIVLQGRSRVVSGIRTSTELRKLQCDIFKIRFNNDCERKGDFQSLLSEVVQNNTSSFNSSSKDQIIEYFDQQCLSYDALAEVFSVKDQEKNQRNLAELILTQLNSHGCHLCPNKNETQSDKHGHLTTWLYSMLAAFAISLTSFTCAFLLPLSNHKYYKIVLMFLISLGVGTLIGTAFLHLIPQVFELEKNEESHMYLWKCLVLIGGIYLFFVVEQVLRFLISLKKMRKTKKKRNTQSIELQRMNGPDEEEAENLSTADIEAMDETWLTRNKSTSNSVLRELGSKTSELIKKNIAPVAWIIMAGEGLHNFIDGLSIGAAFSENLVQGISLSVAILCEEFPHKLGDFAIMIGAGMPFKLALFCNFVSSCFIYVGTAAGIVLGDEFNATTWIFAIAAGMFIYIAVCDMLPELSDMGLEVEKEYLERKYGPVAIDSPDSKLLDQMDSYLLKMKIRNIILQNLGVLAGVFCMFILAMNSKNISF